LVKILKFFDADPGWKKFGSKMEKSPIREREKSQIWEREKHPRSATLFIPDPKFSIPDPGSWVKTIPNPESRSASKNLNIFNPKNCF
jgi:hypothetical protein